MTLKISVVFLMLSPFLMVAQQLKVKQGIWRGVLILDKEKNLELPFNFRIERVEEKIYLIIKNATEEITVDEITFKDDSLNFKMPVFDSEFRTKIIGDNMLEGVWINHSRKDKNVLAFKAEAGKISRFDFLPGKPLTFYEGKWECSFSPGTADSSKAIGIFKHDFGSVYVSGTFLTETGDYRYLDGMMFKGKLYLSCFDGAHAFLFTAESADGTAITNGDFYSGAHHHEKWIAKRNEKFKLKDAESITYLKNPDDKINFLFPNLDKKQVSLNDEKFKNKVIIVQIMGSWCPNCMDETKYLAKVYKEYKKKGLEIVSLAYERTDDFNKAKANVTRLKNKFGVEYEILITGLSGKDKASQSLPFLNSVTAFPTTIILDRNHNVKSIYTGFNGPATGKEYENYTAKTESLITQLLLKK